MPLRDVVRVAVHALLLNKLRSVLAMLGLIIGIAAVILILAIGQGAFVAVAARINALGTNLLTVTPGAVNVAGVNQGAGTAVTLTLRDSQLIAQNCPDVRYVSPEIYRQAQIVYHGQNTATQVLGVTPHFLEVRNWQVAHGRFFSNADEQDNALVAVVGATTARDLFGTDSLLGKHIEVQGQYFEVIGVMAPKGENGQINQDDRVYLPVTTAIYRIWRYAGLRNQVNLIAVEATHQSTMDAASVEIRNVLRYSHHLALATPDDFSIRSQTDILQTAQQVSGTLSFLLVSVAAISLVVGGIGIMNVMLIAVTERTREVGLRKAVGARRRDILLQFLGEAVVICMTGGIGGVAIGLAAAQLLGKIHLGAQAVAPIVSPESVVIAFGVSALVGLFFGFYPAQRAAALSPIIALRHE